MTLPRKLTTLISHNVGELRGVGEKKTQALREMEIETVFDLLTHYPRRYIDRTSQHSIVDANVGDTVTVLATIKSVATRRMRNHRTMVTAIATDEAAEFSLSFFNQPWRASQLSTGAVAAISGKLSMYKGKLGFTNPLVDLVGNRTGRIIPVYPQSDKAGISSWELAEWITEALDRSGELADPLTAAERRERGLLDLTTAMRAIHRPDSMKHAMAARKRLAFDELLRLQTLLMLRRRAIEAREQGMTHVVDGDMTKRFFTSLPFVPTRAQEQAIDEIARDLAGVRPMHRLLQGDVGSGKTLVAVSGFMMAAQGGHQSALMAPTEVLAEQHAMNVTEMLSSLFIADETTLFGSRPLHVALITAKTPAAKRRAIEQGIADGEVDVVIGTHALLTASVQFASLGFVVIDEQHRFGVDQRALLREKGPNGRVPDVLVMTATPIPRTAAMTVYGDLDVSELDELPPGRTPITTVWSRTKRDDAKVWRKLREEVKADHQGYVVCPLVDASDRVQARAATEEYARLCDNELSGLRVGLLHGQMSAKEKELVMAAFRQHELDVLVATTVIEVGVDVSNATVMVIEDAGRFGIAQLHQLRGRVGRSSTPSSCYLLDRNDTEDVTARLDALVASTDGFELAEVDLEIRGSGSILGVRQKGRSDLKLATLRRADRALLVSARELAAEIVQSDPTLSHHDVLADDVAAFIDESETEYLFRS